MFWQIVKSAVRRIPVYYVWWDLRERRDQARRNQEIISGWENAGRPCPPPHLVKQCVVLEYALKYGLQVLVETGTYRGDMVEAMRRHFCRIYSIELGVDLFLAARERFRDYPHIEIIYGDSGRVLKDLMGRMEAPALFWLDGHYSGDITAMSDKETPIIEELTHIFDAPDLGHVLLIDDARCFGDPETPAYPSLPELSDFIWTRRPGADICIADDCIAVVPGRAKEARLRLRGEGARGDEVRQV